MGISQNEPRQLHNKSLIVKVNQCWVFMVKTRNTRDASGLYTAEER